ncbi:MAG TPA: flagellar assembly protein FliH [Chromatiaceae bacterium]|nr:flagellar assembly protein FliH [Chromatiaceae bacterium]
MPRRKYSPLPSVWLTMVKLRWAAAGVTSLSDSTSTVLQQARRWQAPSLSADEDNVGAREEEGAQLPTAAQLEALHQQAREEGYRQGLAEGLREGREQTVRQINQLDQLLQCLAQPFEKLDSQVEEQLVTLALAVARQLVRREIKSDPGQIVGVIREATGLLPVASGKVQIELHPEDAALVREVLNLDEEDERSWHIREIPTLSRGGCRIVTSTSNIDATVEGRLNQVIAEVLGGERVVDTEA